MFFFSPQTQTPPLQVIAYLKLAARTTDTSPCNGGFTFTVFETISFFA